LPGWRNWQTRRTQNPVPARECRFDPDLGYHLEKTLENERNVDQDTKAMSKFSDFLSEKKVDTRRLLVASRHVEHSTPEDRSIKLAKRRAKAGDESAKELAAKKPRSGRALTRPTLERALRGDSLSRKQRGRLVRAVNAVLESKKQPTAKSSDLF
jgi:hypothetical protein